MRFRRRVIFIKKKAPLKFRTVFILSFILFSCMTVISLYVINASIKPIIMDIANLETQKVATSTINYSLNEVIKNVDTEELIIVSNDESGTPVSFNLDSEIYSQVLAESVANAQKYLKALEEGKLHELVEGEEGLDEIEEDNGIVHYIFFATLYKITHLFR